MYYPFFLTYIITGVLIAVLVFAWALKNRQFTDQQRARFLALEKDRPGTDVTPSWKGRLEIYCIFFLALAAITASFAMVVYALFFT